MNRFATGCCLVLLVCLAVATTAHSYQSVQLGNGATAVTIKSQDSDGLTLELQLGDAHFYEVQTREGVYTLMSVDALGQSGRVGEPSVPVLSRLIQIPFGCELSARAIASEVEEIDLGQLGVGAPVIPVQPSLSKSDDPASVPFEIDQATYQLNDFYRLPTVEAEATGIMRGVRLGRVQVNPVEYNPVEHKIRVYKRIEVEITFEHADWGETRDMYRRFYSPAYEGVFQSQVLNYESPIAGEKDDLVTYPIYYVIVSDRMFESQLGPFIDWKTQKGFDVDVFYTDEIGTSNSVIADFLDSLYYNSTPAPSFVLFVGDDNQISAFDGTAGSHITDLYFCEFTGDNYPEIYYGRFSAQNPDQLQPQIDKTLEYEQYLMPDPSYLEEVTLVSGVDGTFASTHGNGQINYGTNYYFDAAHGISPHVWLYPASAGSGAASDIIQTVSDGVSLYNYTAHCGHTGHGDPSFTTSDLPGLTNYHQYLLGIGNCCLPNTFGDDYSTPCFGEAFLQLDSTGGIGYIGATNSTYWDEDYFWGVGYGPVVGAGPTYEQTTLGAYDGVFHDHGEPVNQHYNTNSAIIFAGNMGVDASTSSRKTYYWEAYHLMGDPSVMSYLGVPTLNTVYHEDAVIMTTTSLTVEADPGSYVGVMFNGELQGSGYVDASGTVDIPLVGFGQPGEATITITCQFRQPYIETIQVIAPSGPYVVYDYHTIDDAAGNANGMIDFGESIVLGLGLKNVGPDDALDVAATISTADEYVTLVDSTESYGTIVGDNGTGFSAGGFAFDVAGDVPDGHRITFDIEVTGTARETWTGSFSMFAHAPSVEIADVSIDDSAGDNNGILDPGETVFITLDLQNIGSGQVFGVAGDLSESDEYITVDDSYGYFGFLDANGGTADNSADVWQVSADSSCPLGYGVPMAVNLTGDGGYAGTLVFNITVGDRIVFYFDDFSWDQGWTGLGGSAEWEIGPAVGANDDPPDDHTPTADDYLLGNDIGGEYNSSISGTEWVYSPVIDCGTMSGVQMKYFRWLGVESSSYDHAYLDVYDGSSWVRLFENDATMQESSWNERFFDLSDIADSNGVFQIRYGLGPTDGSVEHSGWNIDDIELKGYGRVGQPVMEMPEGPFADSLQPGDQVVEPIWILNTGEGTLRVSFTSEETWLDFSGDMQVIMPGDSIRFDITLNAEGMDAGTHTGSVDYTSNDATNETGSLNFLMHIHAPDIMLDLTSVDETLESGQQTAVPMVISNNGPGRLDYTVGCQMFAGTKSGGGQAVSEAGPVQQGMRPGDSDKSDAQEPFYAPQVKGFGGPDTFGHSWIDSDEAGGPAVEWVDISAVGTEVTLGDDEATGAIPIGFGFPLYDSVYSELYFNSNGLITFDEASDNRYNVGLPGASDGALIAAFWDDMDPRRGGNIYYYHDTANGRFIVSWNNVPFYYSITGTGDLSFQAVLYENGYIQLNYGVMDPGEKTLDASTIGIQNTMATDGLTVVYNADYMHDNLSILFTAQHWLAVTPAGGSVDPYSEDTVSIEFDATDMEDGAYDGQLTIGCNDPDTPSSSLPVTLTVASGPVYVCGDANGSGDGPNIEDLVYLVSYMFNDGPPPPVMEACDVNGNGSDPDIEDLVYLVSYMFDSGPGLNCPN